MAGSEFNWSEVQEHADEPLRELLNNIEKQVSSNFGKYPQDPFDRQQFEIRVQEAAVTWARSATDIYCKALIDARNVMSNSTARIALRSGLIGFLEHRVKPHVEAAFAFGEGDRVWLSVEPTYWLGASALQAAQAKYRAISRILKDLLKRTQSVSWWIPGEQNDTSLLATPEELAGNEGRQSRAVPRVGQIPKLISPVGASRITARPKPAEVPTDFPPDYPHSLRLKTSLILREAVKDVPDRSQLELLCRNIVSRLAPLLCGAVRDGTLQGHSAPDRLNELLHYIRVANCGNGNEQFRIDRAVMNSDEWHEMVKQLSEIEAPGPLDSTGATSMEASTQNLRRIDEFIEKLRDAGHPIIRKDIWLVAGYTDPTEFERYQRESNRATAGSAAKFNRVLNMAPEEFMRSLAKRRPK